MRPSRCTSAAERVDVAQPGGVAVARHHRPQQLRGAGAPMHPQVLGLGVLTFGLRGIELPLATLGAVDLQLRGHLTQPSAELVVPAARPPRRRAASSSSAATASGALCASSARARRRRGGGRAALAVGLGLHAQLVVGRLRPLRAQDVR